MLVPIVFVVVGFLLLTGAAEALVYGAASIARRVGLSALVIGITVVSIGTSLPELVVSLDAVLGGAGDLALGNIVGSNIGNLALILGVAALARPMLVQAQVVWVEGPILVGVSVGFVALTLDGSLGRVDGALLVGGLGTYLFYTLRVAKDSARAVRKEFERGIPEQHRLGVDAGFVGLGILGLMGGAHLLVEGAVAIAEMLGVGPLIIGLTVVAVGTSLPELATSVVAARRGQGDIAVGNAVGSSIFNILGILGLTVLVRPLPTPTLGWVETGFLVGTAVLVIPLFWSNRTLSRGEGALLVVCYLGYLAVLTLV